MKILLRFLGVSAVILVMLLVTSMFGQAWLSRQREAVKADLAEAKRARFHAVVEYARVGLAPWDEKTTRFVLGSVTADRVVVVGTAEDRPTDVWTFEVTHTPPGLRPQVLRFHYTPPRLVRMLGLYERAGLALVLLTLTLGALLAGVLLIRLRGRWSEDGATRSPFSAEMGSLAGLAKVSAEQSVQLERERNERLRIQEDLNFQQALLNRALEEKIRLGHDLHDGIIQALYATGLTLEAAKKSSETNPGLSRQQLEAALDTLNRTIRDVRSYILGLAPENLRTQSFADAVRSIADTLGTADNVQFNIKIDDQAASTISETDYGDLVQIVRESVSNSLRHGHASAVTISLARADRDMCLVVEDDGRGFSPETAVRGRGLDNMQTRASRLGAEIQCTSKPGSGSRTVVVFRTR